MANNTDEFEQEDFESGDESQETHASSKKSMAEAWQSRPMVKLGVIMLVVGVAIAGALGAFSGPPKAEIASRVVKAPDLNEPPGGKASPAFAEENRKANEARTQQALEQGGSSMPTPTGRNLDISELTSKKDPMMEFRVETERLKQEIRREQQMQAQQLQVMQQQNMSRGEQQDDTLARAMQKQMQQMLDSWAPDRMKLVAGTAKDTPKISLESLRSIDTLTGGADADGLGPATTIVAAGTVNYGQILTEANSDVPGPVLVQIASGPFAGGRAIGEFQTMNEYLVIKFTRVSYKGQDYHINAIALDPNTTLSGMATEVDNRYFSRLVLPAAASFLSSFGQTMAQTNVKTTVSGDVVIVDQAKKGSEDAMYEGLGEVAKTAGRFFQERASQIKPLVRVAVGTPMGVFFVEPVTDRDTTENLAKQQQLSGAGSMAMGYQQGYVAAREAAAAAAAAKAAYATTSAYPQANTAKMPPYITRTGAPSYSGAQ